MTFRWHVFLLKGQSFESGTTFPNQSSVLFIIGDLFNRIRPVLLI